MRQNINKHSSSGIIRVFRSGLGTESHRATLDELKALFGVTQTEVYQNSDRAVIQIFVDSALKTKGLVRDVLEGLRNIEGLRYNVNDLVCLLLTLAEVKPIQSELITYGVE